MTESFAAPNVLTVDVVRTPQYCSARLSRQQELKSASYVNTSLPEEKAEIIMSVERGGVENKTSNSCGLTVKTSLFTSFFELNFELQFVFGDPRQHKV